MCSYSFLARRASCIVRLDFATAVGAHELLLHQMKPLLFLCDFSIAKEKNSLGASRTTSREYSWRHRVFLYSKNGSFHNQCDASDFPATYLHWHIQKDAVRVHNWADNIFNGLSSECSCLQSFRDLGFWFPSVWFRAICFVARLVYMRCINRTALP